MARACDGFSGAEIEEAIISALFDAFSKQEELRTDHIKNSLSETVPLSKTMSEEINRLKSWATGRATGGKRRRHAVAGRNQPKNRVVITHFILKKERRLYEYGNRSYPHNYRQLGGHIGRNYSGGEHHGICLGSQCGPVQDRQTEVKSKTEIEVENSEILKGAAGTNEEIVVEKEGIRAVFTRDARGSLRVCMEGTGYTKGQLRHIGQELIDRVTQQYVYHRVVSGLKQHNMTIVDEAVKQDRTVKIRIRNS